MKIITASILAITLFAVVGCGNYLKRKDDNFWGQATPHIGQIVND